MKHIPIIKNIHVHDKALNILDNSFNDINECYQKLLKQYPDSYFKVNNNIPFNGHFLIIGKNYLITKHSLIGITPLFKYKDYFVFKYKKVNYLKNNVYQVLF